VCDQPFVADADDCSGQICNCYFGAPLPLSSGNTPACVVNRFADNISGTANVDTGAGKVDAHLASVVYLGDTLVQPCPVCGGTCSAPAANVGVSCAQGIDCDSLTLCAENADCTNAGATCIASKCYFDGVCSNYDPTPNDGTRGGTCYAGDNDGQSCDIQSRNTTFPAPQSGGYSLDCFPAGAKNVAGGGLRINLSQTTGSVSLPANVLCGYPEFNVNYACPCGVCTGDQNVPCSSNADCTGLGSCQRKTNGLPLPNQCDGNVCSPTGNGEGECSANAFDDKFCDAIVRSSGEGLISCQSNADCDPANIGLVAGACTITKKRECFLDPITATGVQDAAKPFGVTAFCIAATSNDAINTVAGLPGPGRVKNQASSRLFCASNPAVLYQPGIGGCP